MQLRVSLWVVGLSVARSALAQSTPIEVSPPEAAEAAPEIPTEAPSAEPSPAAPDAAAATSVRAAAPWTPAVPPSGNGLVLAGEGTSYFFGVTPGLASQSAGLSSGTTGFTNIGGRFQGGLAAFLGGAWSRYLLDAARSASADARGRLTLGAAVNGDTDETATAPAEGGTGFGLTLSLERGAGEYLHYDGIPEVAGLPAFVGAWGSVSGGSLSSSKEAAADTETLTVVTLPFRVSAGAGLGRVYPIHWRVTLQRIEAALMAEGALGGPLPEGVAATIIAEWYAARERFVLPIDPNDRLGWSAHHAFLGMLQILRDAGLLKKPVTALTAYRLQRLLLDETVVDRWQGWELRGGLRTRYDVAYDSSVEGESESPGLSLAIEVLGRAYYNLSLTSDLRFEPSVAVALRESDEAQNDLRGARRVSLQAAPAFGNTEAFLPAGRVVLDLPVIYTRFLYDAGLDLAGFWTVHAGSSAGFSGGDPALGASAGAAYTFLTSGRTGYTLGFNAGLGLAGGELAYQVNLVAVLGVGTGESDYTAPDQVGDDVPFDTSWLPTPGPRGM